jgi:hypothetical protein
MRDTRTSLAALSCLTLTLTLSLASSSALADQLQCNSQKDAKRAADLLRPGTLMLEFCSMCEDDVQVVHLEEVRVVQDCEYEVQVTGAVVARSTEAYREAYPADARYDLVNEPFQQEIDLAYAYVETAPNVFSWLGGVLKLKADVKVKSISLPREIYSQLDRHAGPAEVQAQPQVKREPAQRRMKLVSLGFNLFDAAGVRDVIKAFDARDAAATQAATDKLLELLVAQTLANTGLKGLPAGGALKEVLTVAFNDRMNYPTGPLHFVRVGRELLLVEKLPTAKLEAAMAALAVWAGARAVANDQAINVEGISRPLMPEPMTLADLYRRAPRAAALAQFYAFVYLRALGLDPELSADLRLLGNRLKQYFDDEKGAFKGNYSEVLGKLLK